MKLHWIFHRYMAPANDGGDGGGGVDRGDAFTPTGGDAPNTEPSAEDKARVGVTADNKVEPVAGAEKSGLKAAGEAAPGDEGDGEGKGKGKEPSIPLSRHKEILENERTQRATLERELANSKQAQTVQATNEKIDADEKKLTALEAEYAELLSDGKTAEAVAKMSEVRKLERGIIEAKGALATQAAEARAYERVRYDAMCDRIEDAYPELREGDAKFDPVKSAEVIELMQAYASSGKYTRADALQKAVKTLMPAKTTRQETATEADVRVDKAEVARAQREAAARAKAADAASKQPPSLSKVGTDSDKMGGGLTAKAVMDMSQDQFAKLDEASLAKIRGDELAA